MSKLEIINWFKNFTGATELYLIDDSSDMCARHVCLRGNRVLLIPKFHYRLNTPKGVVTLEYYQCNECGKVILNRNFI